ncbi:hypothetical protein CEQ90_00800 [Lewinellaceae bacterium SD302]|nr:hypothetical protein CEQ90_00800 [Lewinellaceae bacterium SD302]
MPRNETEKILIITYYWPPSGGAGVLRWLMLSKCLVELGVEVHVLTVDPEVASFPVRDDKLVQDVHPGIRVFTTNSFEPVSIYARMAGKDKVPAAGFSNVGSGGWKQRTITWLRSNLFHPDPRIGWKRYAVKKGLELINEYDYSAIITTSPPHSVQMIGRALKRKQPNVPWIADLRDPWTDIYYYELLQKSGFAQKLDVDMEKSVVREADHLLTISEGFRDIYLAKTPEQSEDKFSIIPNGFATEDFSNPAPEKDEGFTITYTGSIGRNYEPFSFLDTVGRLQLAYPDRNVRVKFVGVLDAAIVAYLEANNIGFEQHPPVTHSRIVDIQRSAHALLLVSPAMKTGDFIIPGKAFEYLAAGNPIIGLAERNSETASLLDKTKRGKCFAREETDELYAFLEDILLGQFTISGGLKDVMEYSRESQAREVLEVVQAKKH